MVFFLLCSRGTAHPATEEADDVFAHLAALDEAVQASEDLVTAGEDRHGGRAGFLIRIANNSPPSKVCPLPPHPSCYTVFANSLSTLKQRMSLGEDKRIVKNRKQDYLILRMGGGYFRGGLLFAIRI